MCFRTTILLNNTPKALVAKEDIECWKVLTNYFRSPMRSSMQWTAGWHYFITNKNPFSFSKTYTYRVWNIERGLHSFKSLYHAKRYFNNNTHAYKYVKMIIPKGAKYFVNKSQYVSSDLVFPEFKLKNKC